MPNIDQAVVAKTYAQDDRRWVVAQQIWMVLVGFAMTRNATHNAAEKTLSYDALASDLGWSGRDRAMKVRGALGLVGLYCAVNKLPMLNLLVVESSTGRPGSQAVIPHENADLASLHRRALAFRWASVRVPTPGAFRRINVQWSVLIAQANCEALMGDR